MLDFYELLGVERSSSKDEIKKAYHSMVKKYHPDVNGSKEANEIIRSLNEAKEILLNDEKRKKYDFMLDDMDHSKQFSKKTEETYTQKSKVYKETYKKVYVTKFEYFLNYLRNSVDSLFLKTIKSLLVLINFLFFFFVKWFSFVFVWIIYIFNDLIDYLIGFLFLFSVISFFIVSGNGFIPFVPANVERSLLFLLGAVIVAIFKEIVLVKSVNVFVFFGNVEEKIFVKILMK